MTTSPKRPRTHSRVDKFGERRRELARSALTTLAERGYAHTSLRDIANNSDFTHGVLHYYFADKNELIILGVMEYKAQCITRYDDAIAQAESADDLRQRFAAATASSLVDEATLHRLWYDMRAQSYFDEGFRPAVGEIERSIEAMIWRVIERHAEFIGRPPAVTPVQAYAVLDGLFQQALFQLFADEAAAAQTADNLAEQVSEVLVKIAAIGTLA
jgi:AcrR family transcriptional regulator